MRKMLRVIAAAAIVAGVSTSASAAPLAEFLLYPTEDKVPLNALMFAPKSPTKSVVIMIPGMTGGFSGGAHDYAPMAQALTDKGYAFMVPNMRTAGLHGMLFARFDDYTKDVAAAVAEAKRRGLSEIILFGTSLGGPRAIHYWTKTKDPAIKAMGFLASIKSPYLEAQLRFDDARKADFDAFLVKCRLLVAQGRGKDVLTYENWFPGRHITVSATSFIEIFGTPEESDATSVKFGPQLTIPAVVIHGTKDEIALPPNATAVYDSLTAAPKREIVWVEGASHYLTPGPIAENYAKAVVDWVTRALPPTQ
jgi:alpha-beta hydrolase superfamily lysophospholipase